MLQYDSYLNAAFAALADPTRHGIVARLCACEMSVGQLAEPLHMSLSAVGQHLRALENSGPVVSEKRGRTRYCRVDTARLSTVEGWLRDHKEHTEHRLDQLEMHLSKGRKSDDV